MNHSNNTFQKPLLLPSESLCSLLMRKAWFNDYSISDIAGFVGYQRAPQAHPSFLNLDWYFGRKIYMPDGFIQPNNGESLLSSELKGFQSLWFSKKFRFCPICLENGYHSYWFQLHTLKECPVHGCLISSICYSCGADNPQYSFGQGLFFRVYVCSVCGRPISGADPQVQFLRGMCEHTLQIEKSFRSLEQWARSLKRRRILDLCFRTDRIGWHDWCDFSSIQSVLAYKACELPTEYRRAPREDVRFLFWRTRMNARQSGYTKKRKNYFETRFMDGVLRSVMRRLEDWIFDGRSPNRLALALKDKVLVSWPLNPKKWNAKDLAYFVFVDAFSCGNWPDLNSRLLGIEFSHNDLIVIGEWEGRIPRVAFRNFLYAVYAGLYLKILAAQKNNIECWAGLRQFNVLDLIIVKSKVSMEGVSSGFFVFPEIEGFPYP